MGVCTLCVRNLYLSEPGRDRRKAGAADEYVNAVGGALWSWLRLDIDGLCGHLHLHIYSAGPLSQLDVLPGESLHDNNPPSELELTPLQLQCFCAMTLFYCAHWQTYVSGTLRFGKVDVTEAQVTIMIIQLISAAFGSSIWTTKVTNFGAYDSFRESSPYNFTQLDSFSRNPRIGLVI